MNQITVVDNPQPASMFEPVQLSKKQFKMFVAAASEELANLRIYAALVTPLVSTAAPAIEPFAKSLEDAMALRPYQHGSAIADAIQKKYGPSVIGDEADDDVRRLSKIFR